MMKQMNKIKFKKVRPMCSRHKKLHQDGFFCLTALGFCAISLTFTFGFIVFENYTEAFTALVLTIAFLIIGVPYVRLTIKYGDSKTDVIRGCHACTRLNEQVQNQNQHHG